MTDNLFDEGEPIKAKQTVKKRRTRRKQSTGSVGTELPKLGVYRLHDDVQMPYLATEQSACFDIRAYIDVSVPLQIYTADNCLVNRVPVTIDGEDGITLSAGERILMPTGIVFDIPEGYSVREHPRSGSSLKEALTLINGEGVIDSDYVEEGFIPLVNHSNTRIFIKHGQRCAQVEMVENLKYDISEISDKPLRKTSRKGGFGHSGKK